MFVMRSTSIRNPLSHFLRNHFFLCIVLYLTSYKPLYKKFFEVTTSYIQLNVIDTDLYLIYLVEQCNAVGCMYVYVLCGTKKSVKNFEVGDYGIQLRNF